MIKLPIAKLANPLDGTFDLSQCGDAGKYLQISTGYRKIKRSENHSTIEIWLTPRFLIEKEINTTAKHFQPIFDKWKNDIPMGIFFTWGDWDDLGWYDYLTKRNMNTISKKSLFENWNVSRYTNYITPRASYTLDIRDEGRSFTDYFFISFNSPTNNTCAEIK